MFFCSCASKKNYTYLNDINNVVNNITDWEKPHLIQVNDVLDIKISSDIKEVSLIYNKNPGNILPNNTSFLPLFGYLVNSKYEIQLPVIGVINIKGMSLEILESYIQNLLIENMLLKKPIVRINILNNKFTVLGEVANPGTFSYIESRINIFQALGYSGDITSAGKKKEVTLIREINNKREIITLDLTSSDFIKDDSYYIRNNDILIVKPNFSKIKSSGFIGNASSITAFTSMIVSITLLLLNK